jgi:hypothetical protein
MAILVPTQTRTRYVFIFDSQLQQTTMKFLDWGSVLYLVAH